MNSKLKPDQNPYLQQHDVPVQHLLSASDIVVELDLVDEGEVIAAPHASVHLRGAGELVSVEGLLLMGSHT